MTLPELFLQSAYGKLAWAIVIATVLVSVISASRELSMRAVLQLLGISVFAALLPGQLSPVYWLALAFQWPSGMLVGLCVLRLAQPYWLKPGDCVIPAPLAIAAAGLGVLLYLDALGLASFGLYFWGFGPRGAPVFALAAMALCMAGIVQGYARPHLLTALGAIALFTMLRLPTGNLWDALLDPLLWLWAIVSLGVRAWGKLERNTNKINQGVVSGNS